MKTHNEILNEVNPYLREIWSKGWDKVKEVSYENSLHLIDFENREVKKINLSDFNSSIKETATKSVVLIDGRTHRFISEIEGDPTYFRELIS